MVIPKTDSKREYQNLSSNEEKPSKFRNLSRKTKAKDDRTCMEWTTPIHNHLIAKVSKFEIKMKNRPRM